MKVMAIGRKTLLGFVSTVLLLVCPGCAFPGAPRALTPNYRAENVFVWNSSLPSNIRRVALLPMTCDETTPDIVEGRDALEPIVREELTKLRRFELTPISSDALRTSSGRCAWSCEDKLSPDLFSLLGESSGCDAVLFCRLTVFRGYAPLAVGWRMRLVDVRTHATLWASDEVFDSRRPGIQSGARHYQLAGRQDCMGGPDKWVIENSPRQFGQYAAAQLLATLPGF